MSNDNNDENEFENDNLLNSNNNDEKIGGMKVDGVGHLGSGDGGDGVGVYLNDIYTIEKDENYEKDKMKNDNNHDSFNTKRTTNNMKTLVSVNDLILLSDAWNTKVFAGGINSNSSP